MFWLSQEQKDALFKRTLKVDAFYPFPRFEFPVFHEEHSAPAFLSSNPYVRRVFKGYFVIKEFTSDGLVRGNFYGDPIDMDFCLRKNDLEKRMFAEVVLLSSVGLPLFLCQNTLHFLANLFKTKN